MADAKPFFDLFGLVHISILAAIALAVAALSRLAHSRRARWIMAALLAANELYWYWFNIHKGWYSFPGNLPLNLCDLTVWLTVAALLTLNRWSYELAYFLGVGGSSMAVLTPDLWEPFPSYPTVYFFLAHGAVIACVLALTLPNILRPTPGCVWRSFTLVNIYAAAIALFNLALGTNYFYLCRKPANPSLLDYFGPWPMYILVGEAFTLAFFYLLWLPISVRKRSQTPP